MKNDKTFLIIFLILVIITTFSVFRYVSSLREENKALSSNIDQIVKRTADLESDKTMKKITALKAENASLRREIEDLKAELSRISKKLPKPSKTVTGNKGVVTKGSKPTP